MIHALASPNPDIKAAGRGTLVLSGRAVEVALKPGHCREFIDRVFSIPEVRALELDLNGCRARLRFEPGSGSTAELLRTLAVAMRSPTPAGFELPDLEQIHALARDRPIALRRAGDRLTFLRFRQMRAERYRFQHPAFADPSVRRAIIMELLAVAYLTERVESGRLGGSIEVEFQVGRITLESLLEVIEAALLGTLGAGPRYQLQPLDLRRRLVETNLFFAILSDFLFPPAQLLSVFTLWLLNARHARPTLRSLRALRFDLDVLYTTIACLTLLSFSFIASGLMYWLFDFWPRRVKGLRDAESAKFLARLKRCPRSVWVDRGGTEMEVRIGHLQLGDTVILRQGDVAPGDGVVLSGDALLSETWAAGLRRKKQGDVIHCSGEIASGETRMRLDSLGAGAVTSQLAAWHGRALSARVSDESVKRTATAAVLPTLAFGILALWRGGISMAKATIRADYVTGPRIARELGWVASVIQAAQNGIFLPNESLLEKLAQCDCYVFGPGVAWQPGERPPAEIGDALRNLGVVEILTPGGSMAGGRALAVRQPGLPDGVADSSPIDAGGLIKERQYLGRQVAFFGDCAAYAEASAQADVAIHICRPPYREEAPSGIALLEPALEGVLALRGIAADYDARLRGSYLTALVPNAACVIGALTFGLPVLGVVALTNVGAFASYLEAGRAVRAARVP